MIAEVTTVQIDWNAAWFLVATIVLAVGYMLKSRREP